MRFNHNFRCTSILCYNLLSIVNEQYFPNNQYISKQTLLKYGWQKSWHEMTLLGYFLVFTAYRIRIIVFKSAENRNPICKWNSSTKASYKWNFQPKRISRTDIACCTLNAKMKTHTSKIKALEIAHGMRLFGQKPLLWRPFWSTRKKGGARPSLLFTL